MGVLRRLDGSIAEIPDHEMGEALASGKFRPVDDEQDIAIVEDGDVLSVKGKDYETFKKVYGSEDETAASFNRREDRARMENEHDTVLGKAAALGEGFASGLTLGAYDAVGGFIGGDDFRTRRKENAQINSEYDTAGEVLSYLAPTGLAKAPGAVGKIAKYSPVGLAERAGQKIAARGLEKGVAKQVGYAGAGLAAEGAAVGLGESLSEYSLATSDLEREQAIGNVSSNVMFGAATGGVLGATTKGVGLAIKKGKKVADGMIAKAEAQRVIDELPAEVKALDLSEFATARKAEQEAISEQIFKQSTDYQRLAGDVNPMLAAGGKEKNKLISTRRTIDRALANPKGFKKAPGRKIEDALQREEIAYRKILDDSDELLEQIAKEDADLLADLASPDVTGAQAAKLRKSISDTEAALAADAKKLLTLEEGSKMHGNLKFLQEAREKALTIKRAELAGDAVQGATLTGKSAQKYGDFAGMKVTGDMAKEGVDVTADELARFKSALQNGELVGLRKQALDRIPELIDANLAQQEAITMLKESTSPRLKELALAEEAAKEAHKAAKEAAKEAAREAKEAAKRGPLQKIGEGAVLSGVTGLLGAAGIPWTAAAVVGSAASEKLSSMILGRLGKAAKKTAAKTSGYVDTFLDASAKVAQVAPPLATKVLAGVRFGDEDKADRSFHKSELARAFKAREAELYAQVTMGPRGVTMKPAARQKVADQLAGVRLASPQLADSMETMINRRLAFLAKKIPKRPDYMQDSVGPDTWAPSTQEIRGWARYVAAAEDPSGVEERLADGTLTPEDVEAYREVYPERYLDIRQQIATRLPELQATLPIVKRMALSLFTDLDVEPSLHPVIFGRLQAQYGEEPGTEGGSQAPVPQADFGAFGTNRSADKLKTPSQQRST